MHPLKALRLRVVTALRAAGITLDVGGEERDVTILEQPPTGGAIPDTMLPALYCYVRSERIAPDCMACDERTVLLDLVLQAQGYDQQPVDQVDDLQLAVERVIAAAGSLGGLVMVIRPVGSEINVERGEVIFAARRLTFEARIL
uniref:hypothetical protein n=1 Tax=Oceanicella sp. SM1341 TaxID=1548889 RepID=UPI0013007AD7